MDFYLKSVICAGSTLHWDSADWTVRLNADTVHAVPALMMWFEKHKSYFLIVTRKINIKQ